MASRGSKAGGRSRYPGARVRVLPILAVVWLVTTAAAGPPGPAASVVVTREDGIALLSVTAREVSIRALLADVARVAGFRIEGAPPIERAVSVKFERWPLDQALKRLLKWESFVFLLGDAPGAGGSPTTGRLILIASNPSRQTLSVEVSAPAEPGKLIAVPGAELAGAATPEDAQAFNPDGPLEQLLPLVAHRDRDIRTAALEALTVHNEDPRARQLLMDQMSDPDPAIRWLALGLLTPYMAQWPGAEDVVLRAVLDPAQSIRRSALQALVETSSSRGAEAIRLARLDQDAEVRALAEELHRSVGSSPQDGR